MRIAFYAPLKPPDAPTPSGDRRMARLLIRALRRAGHTVEIASRLRTRDGAGDVTRQVRLAALGERLALRYLQAVRNGRRARPDLWFTYHLYYKAPDPVGPIVARALSIPYVVAEASVAHKRAGGPWDVGHRATLAALAEADLVVGFNRRDGDLVRPALSAGARYLDLPPFLDLSEAAAHEERPDARSGRIPELLAVGMMRPGDKAASYRVLADAMARVPGDWRLTLAGDGPERGAIEAWFAGFGDRVRFTGVLEPDALRRRYAASDLLVWPAINEAYGMALLEAQAAGLPVIAGDAGDVAAVVQDGETGLLCPAGNAEAFAAAVSGLLADPARCRRMGDRAAAAVRDHHGLDAVAARLEPALAALMTGPDRCGSS